jgi:hypothetical protein
LCCICRTLDRLAAIIRGPHVPPQAEAELLRTSFSEVWSLRQASKLVRKLHREERVPTLLLIHLSRGQLRRLLGPHLLK